MNMIKSANHEYQFHIFANDTIYYPTEHIIKVISQATFDYQLHNLPEKMGIARYLGFLQEPGDGIDTIHNQPKDATSENGATASIENPEPLKTEIDSTEDLPEDNFEKANLSHYQDALKQIYIEEELRDQNYYFMDRMLKSVLNNEIELWNNDFTRVAAPPIENQDYKLNKDGPNRKPVPLDVFLKKAEENTASILDGSFVKAYRNKPKNISIYSPLHRTGRYRRQYIDLEYWLNNTHIHRSDLVKFCKNQRIEVIFESTQSITNKLSEEEKSIEAANNEVSIPGKIPRINMGKLAIEVAWGIEQASGKRAKAADVMKVLQQWAEEGKHSHLLHKKVPSGVRWLTSKSEEKTYTFRGCGEALKKWNLSRQK
jgi:hypothetical protein